MATRAPDTLAPARTWADDAACVGEDPARYFNERIPVRSLACGRCPVADRCLAEALAAEGTTAAQMRFGIYGGLNPDQRADLALKTVQMAGTRRGEPTRISRNGPAPSAPCGTRSAYRRHQRRGESPCGACKAAEARDRYARADRAARRAAS